MLKLPRKYGQCDCCFRAGSIYEGFDSSTSHISPSLLSSTKSNIKCPNKKAKEHGNQGKEKFIGSMARLDSLLGIQKSSVSTVSRPLNDDRSREIVIVQELLELLSKSSDHVDENSSQVSECASSVSISKLSISSKSKIVDSTKKLHLGDHLQRFDCSTSITVTSSPLRKGRFKRITDNARRKDVVYK